MLSETSLKTSSAPNDFDSREAVIKDTVFSLNKFGQRRILPEFAVCYFVEEVIFSVHGRNSKRGLLEFDSAFFTGYA
jgi:hypothetical protein